MEREGLKNGGGGDAAGRKGADGCCVPSQLFITPASRAEKPRWPVTQKEAQISKMSTNILSIYKQHKMKKYTASQKKEQLYLTVK